MTSGMTPPETELDPPPSSCLWYYLRLTGREWFSVQALDSDGRLVAWVAEEVANLNAICRYFHVGYAELEDALKAKSTSGHMQTETLLGSPPILQNPYGNICKLIFSRSLIGTSPQKEIGSSWKRAHYRRQNLLPKGRLRRLQGNPCRGWRFQSRTWRRFPCSRRSLPYRGRFCLQ
jgi:hypothetical protein